jgi:acetolactate decarboxylase
MHEMHVSLPETAEFLKTDLSRGPSNDLTSAEKNDERWIDLRCKRRP